MSWKVLCPTAAACNESLWRLGHSPASRVSEAWDICRSCWIKLYQQREGGPMLMVPIAAATCRTMLTLTKATADGGLQHVTLVS